MPPNRRQKTRGPARSASFIIAGSVGFNGLSTTLVCRELRLFHIRTIAGIDQLAVQFEQGLPLLLYDQS